VGFLFVLLVFGSAVVSAASRSLAPQHKVPVSSIQTAVGLRGPAVQRQRAAPQRRPAAVDPRALARGIHPPKPPAAAPGPEPVAPAPAVRLPDPQPETQPNPPGSSSLPPLTHVVPIEPESPPEESGPGPPPAEEPPAEEPPAEEPPAEPPLREAGFEDGLNGWSIGGVGEVVPTVVTDIVRTGSQSGKVILTGTQIRSELNFGGDGTGSSADTVEFREGDEYWYGFSFYIVQMVWGHPGAHNLVMQFKSDGEGSPAFGLDLWDVGGNRGLWSEGTATGGQNRFLAPLSERVWYDVAIHFRASTQDNGFYEVFLDRKLIDSRQNTSMIVPTDTYAYIKDGLYRSGQDIPGTSEIRLDSAKLGRSLASVSP